MKRSILNLIFRFIRIFLRDGIKNKNLTTFSISPEGSLGDQAMMDVLISQSSKFAIFPSVICYRFNIVGKLRGDFKIIESDNTIFGSIRKFLQISRSGYVTAIGADIIDGSYGTPSIMNWFSMIEYSQLLKCKSAVINFSFSETPSKIIVDRLKKFKDVTFVAREAVSQHRFQEKTHQIANVSADIAFLLEPEITSDTALQACEWLQKQHDQNQIILAVNASGLTLAKMGSNGIRQYVQILSDWLDTNAKRVIFLVPHDFRPAPAGDLGPLTEIEAELLHTHPGRVYMIHPPFESWDVKALMEHVDGLITGRMHLAIAGLGMYVPPLCIVYVGKFEGLMQHFGLDGLLIEPEDFGDTEKMNALLEEYTQNLPQLRDQIEHRLPEVKQLAMRNFDWLERNSS